MAAHACNPSIQEAEAGGLKREAGLGYIAKTLSQNKANTKFKVIHVGFVEI
jgi:hypothetical protein